MTYHFIGLGGIGMSALARILIQKGEQVQGSDLKSSATLLSLENEGAKVHIGHFAPALGLIQTVVYSSAIQEDHIELKWAKENNIPLLHRSDLLNELMRGKKSILVSGTHGKTTTSALLAHVLMEAKLDPSFVVGGLLRRLNTNAKFGSGTFFVAEADESDGSFLKTPSYAAILTNLEDDHLDYWGSSKALDTAFDTFIHQTEHLFWCADDPRLVSLRPKGISYGFSESAHVRLSNFRETKKGVVFDLGAFSKIELSLFGKHNALNGAAVFALCQFLGVSETVIRDAFQSFAGTARRLEFRGEKHKVSAYDDYGHHPQEIEVTLEALRGRIKERRLVAIFQPHRYTRVRDNFEAFTRCLSEADVVVMTDIYSAGEEMISGITSASLYAKIREKLGSKVHFFPRTHLESGVAGLLKPLDVVLTIGAGDITHAIEPILNLFSERAPKFTVGVLYGGISQEHAVSVMSANTIIEHLDPDIYDVKIFRIDQEGKWQVGSEQNQQMGPKISPHILEELLKCDLCFPVFHGPKGEDGMMAALLDTLEIPYVGCDYRSGSICMHKGWTKRIVVHNNVPIVPFFEMDLVSFKKRPEELLRKIDEHFNYPVWIKPVHLGSSIGVRRAKDPKEALECAEHCFSLDDCLIVEKEIKGRQIEFAVTGNDWIEVAPAGEIVNHGAFVGFDEKYGTGAMEIRAPAHISENEKEIGAELAKKAYLATGCKGLARIDFFLDEEGFYWFNEINPFPGFTDKSAFPKMFQAAGISIEELLDELAALAMHRVRGKH